MKIIVLLLLLPFTSFCQNTIGFPEVINYSRQSYLGGLQNWDIKQDKNGILYVANNEGLLSFDGKHWSLYPLPNRTIVRSIEIGSDGHIYVGGQDELGYFSPGKNGNLSYHSLTRLISKADRSFGDVWDIVVLNKDVFFRSTGKIFQYSRQSIVGYKAFSEWSYMGLCNGSLYAHDFSTGLLRYANNLWQPVLATNPLPVNDPVTAILPGRQGTTLIATMKNGLYILTDKSLNKHPSPNNQLFAEDRIYAATGIDEDWLALATNTNGIYIINESGDIIQQFSKKEQLQNNNVLSIFLDNQRNLWLGLDNGIDFIAYNSAIKHITPLMQDGSGYTALIHDNRLYAGTSNGLFHVELQQVKDYSFSKGNFSPVLNTKGQTWTLTEINNQLLLGHHDGAFRITGARAEQISTQAGFWNFVPLNPVFPAQTIAAGNYKGIRFFEYTGTAFVPGRQITGFEESSRYLNIDEQGQIWVSHPYHGVYRIGGIEKGAISISSYNSNKGLPSSLNNHAFKIRNEIVVGTEKGIYRYNLEKEQFEPASFYMKLLGPQSIRYLREDKEGNIWFIHEKNLGVIDLTGDAPRVIYLPELNNKMLSGFEFIYPVDSNNIFLGGEKGFYHINYHKYKRTVPQLKVQVRKVSIRDNKDSVLFGGYFSTLNKDQTQSELKIPRIASRWKTISLTFSSSLFGYQNNLEYSYRLKGFDDQWSEWSTRTEKEYTNLNEGTYTFEVKVRNNLGNESRISTYTFTMLPPWYKTIWARILYGLLVIAGFYFLYKWQDQRFQQQVEKLEEEQKRLTYIHELERNKTESELVTLRNAKLEAEINFKNSEMASSAMHLVKKGELLTKIKNELSQVMKRLADEQAITEIKKMIKSLTEDEHIDEEWDNFTKHFDKVHSDFIVKLKEIHPTLTSNEIKLCTYLRMNLSTKEIAQLLNISVRGVEISRYRLRKKLGISSEVSLFDYLISVKDPNL